MATLTKRYTDEAGRARVLDSFAAVDGDGNPQLYEGSVITVVAETRTTGVKQAQSVAALRIGLPAIVAARLLIELLSEQSLDGSATVDVDDLAADPA